MSSDDSAPLWWLSYADDDGFRGVVVLRSEGFVSACAEARQSGLSPGGQVRGHEIETEDEGHVPEQYRNRLLNQEEAEYCAGLKPFTAYADEQGNAFAFGTPEFSSRHPDESEAEWHDRIELAVDWLGVRTFYLFGMPKPGDVHVMMATREPEKKP